MLSFIANIANGYFSSRAARGQSAQYQQQAAIARMQGQVNRNAANTQAHAIDAAAATNADIANNNLRTMQENKRAAEGSARVQQAASGLTTEGSGGQNEKDVQLFFDAAINNTAVDASISSIHAFQNAFSTRKQGEIAAMQANLQAIQYESAAKQSKAASHNVMFGTILGAAAGAYTAYQGYNTATASAEAYNNKYGLTDGMDGYIDPTGAGLLAAGSAGSWGFGVANMLNPYTAGMTRGMNWGSNMSILMGNTPGIPDNRYSLAGLTGTKA